MARGSNAHPRRDGLRGPRGVPRPVQAMHLPRYARHVGHLSLLREAALRAVDPGAAVRSDLRLDRWGLHIGEQRVPLPSASRLFLVGIGKAAPAMVQAAQALLGDRILAGVAAVPHTAVQGAPPGIDFIGAGHPLPDRGSLAAGAAARRLLQATRPGDVVLVLISGGGSAMFEDLLPGIRLSDLRRLNRSLLASGLPIQEVNLVRAAISNVKGGGLARWAAPARVVCLILSDVIGDNLSSIASGPTVLRPASGRAARDVLRRAGLWETCPASIARALAAPRPEAGPARRPIHVVIGSNRLAAQAAADQARTLGFTPCVLTNRLHGEANRAGERLARRLCAAPPGSCLILGGETTVTVRGTGRGGRNQEAALAAAAQLDGVPNVAVMALATDGIDGPTDAAGAVVTGDTARLLRKRGIDPAESIARNDSYPALAAAGALLLLGPTGTNVGDLLVGLRYA